MMNVTNHTNPLFKPKNNSNCGTSKSTSVNNDNTNRAINKLGNSKKYENDVEESVKSANDYFGISSNTSGIFPVDSAGSKLECYPQQSGYLRNLSLPSSVDSENNHNFNYEHFSPLVSSSPRVESTDSYSSYGTPIFFNNSKYSNRLVTENQFHTTTNTTKPFSETIFNKTNTLNPKQSLVTLKKYSNSKTNLNKEIQKEATVIDSLFSSIFNSNMNKSKNIDEQSNGFDQVSSLSVNNNFITNKFEDKMITYTNTSPMYNNSQYDNNCNATKDYTKYDKRYLNKKDLSELLQMELNLKLFPGNIEHHLNMLEHDVLSLNKQVCKESKNVNDIVKNIHEIIKLDVNKSICNSSKNVVKDKYSKIPFVSVDCNSLNILNKKLDYVNQLLVSAKLTSNDKMIKEQKKPVDNFDIFEFNHSNKSFSDINSLGFNSKSGYDSFDHIREPNKATELSLLVPPLNLSTDFKESLQEPSFQNFSLKNAADKANKEWTKRMDTPTDTINHCSIMHEKNPVTSDSFDQNREPSKSIPLINSIINFHESFPEPSLENSRLQFEADKASSDIFENATPKKKKLRVDEPTVSINHCSSFQVENHCGDKVEKKRYSLRICPRPTDHYFAPFKPTSVKKKKYRNKTNNDVFICKGKGQKKIILHYKIHSVLKANSNELIKKICPEMNNQEFKGNNRHSSFDISNLKPKRIAKPCLCGIFPSQVPSTWSNSLHTLLHQNLYKLQFKVLVDMQDVTNFNDNGLIYDIIKINGNSDDNQLQSTLKNIKDFINIEVDFPRKNNLNLNHSIYLAVIPNSNVIGYLEVESLNKASIYQNDDQLSENLITVKFGVTKLWVMVKYRNSGVATKLLKQFCNEKHLETNEIAFAHHGSHGMPFIKKFFANNFVLIY